MSTIDAAIIKHLTNNGFITEDELSYTSTWQVMSATHEIHGTAQGIDHGVPMISTTIKFYGVTPNDIRTGNIIKMYNETTDSITSFMFIRLGSETTSSAILVNMETGKSFCKLDITQDSSEHYNLQGTTPIFISRDKFLLDKSKGCGIYQMQKMSYNSLLFLATHINELEPVPYT